MGNCAGGFKVHKRKLQHHKKVRKIRICILGIDGAGKTTTISALASGEINNVLPTNGFALQKFRYRKAEIIAYDLGGGERIRSIWKNYYPEVFGVIYVIDGSERDRIEESGQLLKDVISDEDLNNKPFLVILNKRDRERCIDEIQFTDRFNLHNLVNLYQIQIRVEICQSNAGSGRMIDISLKDGFEWFLEQIYHNYDVLEKRVNEALKKLKLQQDEERIKRQHHLAATISSSSTSEEEKINDADKAVTEYDKQQNHTTTVPPKKSCTNQITNSETANEESKRKKHLRNTINPMGDLPHASIDSGKMKNPQIFEVPYPVVSKRTTSVQTDVIFDRNGDLQSTSKPVRVIQLVPMSVIPKGRLKRPVRSFRSRTDSI